MIKEKLVTLDELWLEFKKAIDTGNWTAFKTEKGMIGYIKRMIKTKPMGKMITFIFMTESGILYCRLRMEDCGWRKVNPISP